MVPPSPASRHRLWLRQLRAVDAGRGRGPRGAGDAGEAVEVQVLRGQRSGQWFTQMIPIYHVYIYIYIIIYIYI